jgi:transmembrane sensor
MNSETNANDQAAAWAARLDAGPLRRDEAEALTRWLDAEPGHERLLDQMQRLHQRVRLVLPEMAASGRLPARRAAPVFRPILAWGGVLAAVLAIAAVWLVRAPDRYATPAAQRQTITLADGTVAELNARTRVQVRLSGAERLLQLGEGEIFLNVAKDVARPFVVETAAGRVRVTGTQFVVSSDGASGFTVLLVEGAVEATPAGAGPRQLLPGDRLSVGGGGGAFEQTHPGGARAAWFSTTRRWPRPSRGLSGITTRRSPWRRRRGR